MRVQRVNELHAALKHAEDDRSTLLTTLLLNLVTTLTSIAHVAEGDVERLMEAEAMQANCAKLANQRAFAALVSKLHVAEVQMERALKQRFDTGVKEWRVLRTRHAIDTFSVRLRSPEFAEAPQRQEHFAALRSAQEACCGALAASIVAALTAAGTVSDVRQAERCVMAAAVQQCSYSMCTEQAKLHLVSIGAMVLLLREHARLTCHVCAQGAASCHAPLR